MTMELEQRAAETRGFSTLVEQVSSLREFSANPQQRIRSGIDTLDMMTEGPAAGEIYTFLGRSFSGKSNVGINIMANNPEVPMMFFSLEMPARQVLQRLYAAAYGVEHALVQNQTRAGSLPEQLDEMPQRHQLHIVIDEPGLTLGDMSAYLEQYHAYFGFRPHAVIIDYLELIQGESGEGHFRTEMVAKRLKDWAKREQLPVFLLHQTNRSEPVWDPPNEDSARGAGYTESDVVVGMWQPGRDPKLGANERKRLNDTRFGVTILMNVLKNRITGRTTDGQDVKLVLEPTLRIVDATSQDLARGGSYERW